MRPYRIVALAVLSLACQSKEKGPATGDSAAAVAARAAESASAAPQSPNVVTVRARDYSFDAPESIPAGMTTFRLVNEGPGFHHMQIVRLDSGKTMADFDAALKKQGPPPRWAVMASGPNAPSPAREANATLDMQPGNYALLCFVDVPDHVPHFARGMKRALTVTPREDGATNAAAPKADVQVTLRDYGFELSPAKFSHGEHTFQVQTAPGQPHELELIRLAPGKTAKDFLGWVAKPNGPPPAEGLGGVAATMAGTPAYFTATLTPGEYALICFLSDAKDGKPHFAHGMIRTISVT